MRKYGMLVESIILVARYVTAAKGAMSKASARDAAGHSYRSYPALPTAIAARQHIVIQERATQAHEKRMKITRVSGMALLYTLVAQDTSSVIGLGLSDSMLLSSHGLAFSRFC
ncbi:hypothetical protein F5Y15DRAFT_396031 [Xylariaceae sp. FL0016]|nr:hypothetical protein F5Y15DRAFT_396031 [Xylariaceae sp. FL0016]